MGFDDIRQLRSIIYNKSETEDKKDNIDAFMPYSSVQHLIENHPVRVGMRVSTSDVHKSLAYIFGKLRNTKETTKTTKEIRKNTKEITRTSPNVYENKIDNRCNHCNNYISLDMRHGDYVCNSCGLIQPGNVYGEKIPLAMNADEYRNLNSKECDIPKWALAQNALGDIWWEISIALDIEHWNYLFGYSANDLDQVKSIVHKMDKRASDLSRIAAGYCMYYMMERYEISLINFTKDCIKYAENKKSLITKEYMCNHTKKRKQWSLVTNRPIKIKIIE